jgi:hypothetical protein
MALDKELVEQFRDVRWRREPERRIETVADAEAFIESVGFAFTMTDARRPGPSLFVGVCGRRDAYMPRNVQKDPESSATWLLKDELLRRGRVYYAKFFKSQATFVAPRLLPYLNALFGIPRRAESNQLSADARSVLRVLRREWEMASSDLKSAARLDDRKSLTKALDELQKTMKVIPSDVVYEPWFTYIWTLAEARFSSELKERVDRKKALREIARAFIDGAGLTWRGELAKVTGLSRVEAGIGNRALLTEGYVQKIEEGVYARVDLADRLGRF